MSPDFGAELAEAEGGEFAPPNLLALLLQKYRC
jgi:hypothetical protein